MRSVKQEPQLTFAAGDGRRTASLVFLLGLRRSRNTPHTNNDYIHRNSIDSYAQTAVCSHTGMRGTLGFIELARRGSKSLAVVQVYNLFLDVQLRLFCGGNQPADAAVQSEKNTRIRHPLS